MSESPHSKPIRPATAERHEAITLRCEALLRQVEAVALRQGQKGVPADVERLAADLICDANPFLPRRRRAPLPVTAPTYAGLAAELAAARAALEAFELRHTAWDPALKCVVWRTAGEPLPVARLHPQPAIVVRTPAEEREAAEARLALLRLIDGRYDEGYTDAVAGKPRSHRSDRFNPDGTEKPWG